MLEYGVVIGVATAFIPIALTISKRISESGLALHNKNCLFRILGVSVAFGGGAALLLIPSVYKPESLDIIRIALIFIVLEVLACSLTVAIFLIRGNEESPRSKPATRSRKKALLR